MTNKKKSEKKPVCKHCGQECDGNAEVIVVRLVSGETWHERCAR